MAGCGPNLQLPFESLNKGLTKLAIDPFPEDAEGDEKWMERFLSIQDAMFSNWHRFSAVEQGVLTSALLHIINFHQVPSQYRLLYKQGPTLPTASSNRGPESNGSNVKNGADDTRTAQTSQTTPHDTPTTSSDVGSSDKLVPEESTQSAALLGGEHQLAGAHPPSRQQRSRSRFADLFEGAEVLPSERESEWQCRGKILGAIGQPKPSNP